MEPHIVTAGAFQALAKEDAVRQNDRHPITLDQATGFPADTGCEVSPSCLRCPLPQCRYDDPLWFEDYRRRQRVQATATKVRALGVLPKEQAVKAVALALGIDARTVYRRLAQERHLV